MEVSAATLSGTDREGFAEPSRVLASPKTTTDQILTARFGTNRVLFRYLFCTYSPETGPK